MKYVSELKELENKKFDTIEDLEKAEEEVKTALAKKEEAKAAVAKESADVQDAFKARNAARKVYNEKLVELRKVYNQALRDAEKAFTDGLKEVADEKDAAEKVYSEKLSAFQKAHPEGYRITLKDGDNVVTLSSNPVDFNIRSVNKEFDTILDLFSDMLRRW